jgi:hypothetical protein
MFSREVNTGASASTSGNDTNIADLSEKAIGLVCTMQEQPSNEVRFLCGKASIL